MKLKKDSCGCIFNDRIDLELSPSYLEDIIEITKEKAMSAKEYTAQGGWRELKEYFQERYDAWMEARDKLKEKQ